MRMLGVDAREQERFLKHSLLPGRMRIGRSSDTNMEWYPLPVPRLFSLLKIAHCVAAFRRFFNDVCQHWLRRLRQMERRIGG
jgi:hypothetical protein